MTGIEAVCLGVIQGLSEFLPISSSGHLALAHHFLGDRGDTLAFDVMLHMGTLLAVIVYFRKEWAKVLASIVRMLTRSRVKSEWDRLTLLLVLATIPGAIFGKLFEKQAEGVFRSPWLIVLTLSAMGFLLLYAERHSTKRRELGDMRTKDAGIIGLSQAVALVPGVSRSGITMTSALFLGFDRETAARFSFLLSAPIIAGAGLIEVPKLLHEKGDVGVLILGFLAALVSGLAAISFLLRYLKSHSFDLFAYYRLALAGVVALLLLSGL